MDEVDNLKPKSSPVRKSLKRSSDRRSLADEQEDSVLAEEVNSIVSQDELEAFVIHYLQTQVRRGLTGQGALLIALVTQRILSELPKSDIYKIEEVKAKADECLDKVKDEGPEEIENFEEEDWHYLMHVAAFQGYRSKMEDRAAYLSYGKQLFKLNDQSPNKILYAGVYDGHGGQAAANYTQIYLHVNIFRSPYFPTNIPKALQDGFIQTDRRYNEKARKLKDRSGTTATVAMIVNNTLYMANVGDSTAVICKKNNPPAKITFDHKASNEDEKKRVKECGGLVVWFGGWRVNGSLAVSRSIGDEHMSQQLIADPYLYEQPITDDDEFVILASDGLWDVFSPEQADQFIKNWLKEHRLVTSRSDDDDDENEPANLSEALVREALRLDSKDNVTVIVIFLKQKGKPPRCDLQKSELCRPGE